MFPTKSKVEFTLGRIGRPLLDSRQEILPSCHLYLYVNRRRVKPPIVFFFHVATMGNHPRIGHSLMNRQTEILQG